MARIRTIKPEFWTSAQITECSVIARLLFIGLWNFADDAGRLSDSPRTIKMQVLPGEDLTADDVHGLLTELSVNGLILRYTVGDKGYIQITGWHHQKINRPNPSKIPSPEQAAHGTITEPSREKTPEGKGREGKGIGHDADASPHDALWKHGVSYIRDRGGKSDSNARSLIGKWVKASTPETVVDLIARAQAEKVIEPVAFIEACLKRGQPKSGVDPGGYRPMGSGAGG